MTAQIDELKATVKAQADQIEALKKSDDEKIAAMIAPRVATSATESKDNVVESDRVQELVDKSRGDSDPVDGAIDDLKQLLGVR